MMSIDDLQTVVTEMKAVRDEARALGVYGGQEACHLNDMIDANVAMVECKEVCTKATKVPADCMMTVEALCDVVSSTHEAALERARKAGVIDSPEALKLQARRDATVVMVDLKKNMAELAAAAITADMSAQSAEDVLDQMRSALAKVAPANCTGAPEAVALQASVQEAELCVRAKAKVAGMVGMRGDASMTTDELHSVIRQMEAVRDEARALGVYGGPEARQLVDMIDANVEMVKGKEACTKATKVPADCMKTVDALCDVVSNTHEAALERARKAGLTDSPEALKLRARRDATVVMVDLKKNMAELSSAAITADMSAQSAEDLLDQMFFTDQGSARHLHRGTGGCCASKASAGSEIACAGETEGCGCTTAWGCHEEC